MNAEPYSLFRLIQQFWPFISKYASKYFVAMSLLGVTIALSLLPPFLLKTLIDEGIQSHNVSKLNLIAVYLAGVLLITGLLRGFMDYIHEWVSAWMIFDIRSYMFAKVQEQSLEFFFSNRIGDVLARLRTDLTAVYSVLSNTFLAGTAEVIQVAGVVGFMFYLNTRLALIALAFIPPLYFVLRFTGSRVRKLSLQVRDKDTTLLEFFHEALSNIHVIKLFSREGFSSDAHGRISRTVIDATLRRSRYKFVSIFLLGTITGVAPILFVWYGGNQVIRGVFTFGSFIAFYLYVTRLYAPIQSLTNRGVEIYNGLASAQRIAEYFHLRTTIPEPVSPVALDQVRGEIAFEHVFFRYPGERRDALSDVNLRIAPGEHVAIVGSSGAGKTTTVNLLCRLYDVRAGQILLDGSDIRDLATKTLRGAIGVVSQDAFLFNDSILENIRFARPEASEAEVFEAAKAAHLHEFVEALPSGYQTEVGSRGLKMSGGQRQRLALARVILKDPPICILDEFTASLDSHTETLIYENLAPLLRTKTVLTIAHRLSTVMLADRVLVLKDGHVVESGTHLSLYDANGLYRTLFQSQLSAGAPVAGTKGVLLQ